MSAMRSGSQVAISSRTTPGGRPGDTSVLGHRNRWWIGCAAAVALAGLGLAGSAVSGAAGASADHGLPGSSVVTELGVPVAMTGAGTTTVDLGAPPVGANSIQLQLTCLTAGKITIPGFGGVDCGGQESSPAVWRVALSPGQSAVTLQAGASARWRIVASYSAEYTTPWGVNAAGQTYGAHKSGDGDPDLVAVIASNGAIGYASSLELQGPTPSNPNQALAWMQLPVRTVHIPVYLADGKTVIGYFDTERQSPPDAPITPLRMVHADPTPGS